MPLDLTGLDDDAPISVTWEALVTEYYTHTFTAGEIRRAIRERGGHGPDVPDNELGEHAEILAHSFLSDYEDEPGSYGDVDRRIVPDND